MVSPLQQAAPAAPVPNNITAQTDQGELNVINKPQPERQTTVNPLEELNASRLELNAQIDKIKANLDRRTNMPFDPMYMQMAAGFLKPTKTGSFGESLGNAAENATSQAEKDWQRNQEISKMNLELGQKQLALRQQMAGGEFLKGLIPGQAGQTTLAGGAPAPAGAPAGTSSGSPAPAAPAGGGTPSQSTIGNAINGAIPITEDMIIRAAPYGPEVQKQLEDIMKRQIEFRKMNLEELKVRQGNLVEIDFPELGRKKVPLEVAEEFRRVAKDYYNTGNKQNLYKFYAENGIISPEFETGEGGQRTIKRPKTVQEQEVEQKSQVAQAEEGAKGEAKDIKGLRTAFVQANTVDALAKNQASLAKSNEAAFNLLQDNTFRQAFFRMVANGVQTPSGSISLDTRDIEASIQNLPQKERTALMMYAQNNALLNLMFTRVFLQGEGQVTEGERAIVGQTTALPNDNPLAIRLKSEALQLRAENDKKVYKGWTEFKKSNKGATLDDYYSSDKYQEITDQYNSKLDKVREANASLIGTSGKGGKPDATVRPTPVPAQKTEGDSIESKAKAAFGTYEPDKYEYRINPSTGNVQRKEK